MGRTEHNEHSRTQKLNSKSDDSSKQDKYLLTNKTDQKVNHEHENRKNAGPSRATNNIDRANLLKSGDVNIVQSIDDVRQIGLFTQDIIKNDDTQSIFNKILDSLATVDKQDQPKNTETPAIVPQNEAKPVCSNQLIHKAKAVLYSSNPSSSSLGKRKRSRSSGSPRKKSKHEGRSSFFYYGKLSDLIFRSKKRGHGSVSDSESEDSIG